MQKLTIRKTNSYLSLIIASCVVGFVTVSATATEFYTPERLTKITENQSKHKALFDEINAPHTAGIQTFGGFKLNTGSLSSVLVKLSSNPAFSSLKNITISGTMNDISINSIKGLDNEEKALIFLGKNINAFSYNDGGAIKVPELGAGFNDTYILNEPVFIEASPIFIKGIPCELMFIFEPEPVKLLDASSKPVLAKVYKHYNNAPKSPPQPMFISTRLTTVKITAPYHELVTTNGVEFLAVLNKKYMEITGSEDKNYFTDQYGQILSIEDNTRYGAFSLDYSTDKDYLDIQKNIFQEYHQDQAKSMPDTSSMF